jgi:hypothetical protein
MPGYLKTLAAVGALTFAASVAHAAELKPFEAKSLRLGDYTGVAYYTVERDGYRVITTLAAGESGTPIRMVATLVQGQRAIVSVPRGVGDNSLEVEIARIGNQVVVSGSAVIASTDQIQLAGANPERD